MVGWKRRWTGVVLAALLLAVAGAAVPLTAQPAGAAGFSLATFGDLAVDPATGRVFVSGGDVVRVFDAQATLVATIPDLFGAGGMDLDGGSLWVAATSAGVIAEIDLTTLEVVRELAVPVTGTSLERLGGGVWYGHGSELERYDLATGTTTAHGPYGEAFESIGTSTTTLLAFDPSAFSPQLRKLDLSTVPATVLGTRGIYNLMDVAVIADGSVAFASSYASAGITEVSIASMTETARTFPKTESSIAVATSPALGGIVASASAFGNVVVSRIGDATPILARVPYGRSIRRGVVVAPDGKRAYLLTRLQGDDVTTYLETVNVAPVVHAVLPSEVVAGVPTVVSVFGDQVTTATAVTVGGVAAAFKASGAHLELTVPTTVPAGTRTVTIVAPTGQVSLTLTLQPNVGGAVAGVVRRVASGAPAAGVTLTLRGPTLASPLVTTSAFDGSYAFTALPYGTYTMTTHASSGGSVDELFLNISVVPNDVTALDVGVRERTVGGTGTASTIASGDDDVVVEPSTKRVFVRGDGFVDAFDAAGAPLARIVGLPGRGALAVGGGKLYVSAGRLVRIDPAWLTVTTSWSTGRANHGDLVHAGGRLWFVYTADDHYNGDVLASLDLATGFVTDARTHLSSPQLASVPDSTDLFYVRESGSSSPQHFVMRASGAVAEVVSYSYEPGHIAASATLDRAWNDFGVEYVLSTLARTGRTLPVGTPDPYQSRRASAATSQRGGLVAIRDHVVRVDTGAEVATTGYRWATAEAFDASADRLYVLASGGLVVWDLRPHVATVEPVRVHPDTTTLVVEGDGLGAATSVVVDGDPVPVGAATPTSVTIPVTSLALGQHWVKVMTTWGTSPAATFEVVPRPTVTAVEPSMVATVGGTVTLTGTGFTGTTSVTLASVPSPFLVVDDRTITLTVPSHLALAGPIRVEGPLGTNLGGPDFAWVAAMPAIDSLFPSFTLAPGSVPVTISGSGFTFATKVQFGDEPSTSFSVVDDTTIVATSPVQAAGAVVVTVTTEGGTSTTTPATAFTYLPWARFTDVPVGAPFEADIMWAASRRITTGYADGTFRPTGLTDRQAMAAMLYRSAGSPLGAHPRCEQAPFVDVAVTNPFCGEISWLKATGVTTGNPDGTFRPSGLVDRQSMAAFLYRLAGKPLGDHPDCARAPFPDVPASSPFCGEISWLVALAITNGYPDGGFHPATTIARQATVAFLHRLEQAH